MGGRTVFLRRLTYGLIGLAGGIMAFVTLSFMLLDRFELGPLLAWSASAVFGRTVTVAGLHVIPGKWLIVGVEGVRVANIPGGSRPVMAELRQLTAEVETLSLLWGPANVRRLEIDGFSLLLEYAKDGTRNWRRGKAPPRSAEPGDRSWVPSLPDVRVRASEITFLTSSGATLRTRLDDATLLTTGPDAPMRLSAVGAYHETPLRLDADLQSIAVLRDASVPYGADVRFTSGDTTLRFTGTLTRPLDVDGAKGSLFLHAPTLGAILAMGGAKSGGKTSLELSGALTRTGDLWVLAETTGKLNDSVLMPSTIRLAEGGRAQADDVTFDLAFDRLNLDPLLVVAIAEGDAGSSLVVERRPDTLLGGRVSARTLSFRRYGAKNMTFSGSITPGQIKFDELAMTVFDGRFQASGQAESADRGGGLKVRASMVGLDLRQLHRAGIAVPMLGRLDWQIEAEATGETLASAARTAHVSAVMWMTGGGLSRDLLEKASIDIRRLFRAPKGMVPISCLLGVIDMHGGIGTISPLRIRTNDGTIAGQGRFDLPGDRIDLVIASQSATTSDFALDIPLRISGSIMEPDVGLASGDGLAPADADPHDLLPALRDVARRNACNAPQ
ncbi:hypothetical protein CWS72_21390 [Telmatospirillum siberiense]|uniref:Uncharacterized protein n=1 Tax=Telmatospirillum siberiense TaxID=382514 RepID=A0A2N3PQ03_9PROT|nr:hypothetical protein CWS72_21390 [Telmatospirillum siberiense]